MEIPTDFNDSYYQNKLFQSLGITKDGQNEDKILRVRDRNFRHIEEMGVEGEFQP